MPNLRSLLAFAVLICPALGADEDGWISLFDGQSLEGWTVNENPETFTVKDGDLIAHGNRSHLFYTGPVQ
ncbi:MAG: family 16 glycoside hydrolase, partial [Chthoniobacteraceae bacterium]